MGDPMGWKIKRNEQETECSGVLALKELAAKGEISPEDYVFNPTLNQWSYARDTAELQGLFEKAKRMGQAGTLKKASWGLAIAGILLFLLDPTIGGLTLVGAAICGVMHHVKAGTVV